MSFHPEVIEAQIKQQFRRAQLRFDAQHRALGEQIARAIIDGQPIPEPSEQYRLDMQAMKDAAAKARINGTTLYI